MIYFIAQGEEFIKIGYGMAPEERLSQLQTGNPNDLRLIAAFAGSKEDERRIHEIFGSIYVRGEWFEFDSGFNSFYSLYG